MTDVDAGDGGGLWSAAKRFVKSAINATLPDVTIVAFKLPTGPRAEDYCLIFDLDETFEALHKSKTLLIRPKFHVWSGNENGLDSDIFGQQLWVNFVHQYEEERDASFQVRFTEMEVLEEEIAAVEKSHNRVVEERTNISICATTWLVGISNVLAVVGIVAALFTLGTSLVLLPVAGVGLWWAKRRINKMERLGKEEKDLEKRRRSLQKEYQQIERALHAEMTRLEEVFGLTEGGFQNAAADFTVQAHHQIVELTRVFRRLEVERPTEHSVTEQKAVQQDHVEQPDIIPYLQTDFYLRWLPERSRSRVQSWIDGTPVDRPTTSYFAKLRSLVMRDFE